jgi:hypothetical protein
VTFYIEQGYPAPAVQYYLRGLANGRLAEMPLPEALAAPIRLAECGTAGPLVDMAKLDDISADYIATLPGEQILAEVSAWASRYAPDLAAVLAAEPGLALRALAIEREGVPNPRKDLRKWSDFRAVYGWFFAQLFELVTDPADSRFGGLSADLVSAVADAFAAGYQPHGPDVEWFDQVRRLAADLEFAPSQKAYKQDPAAYNGSIREASQVIRVLLTGSQRSPDLADVAAALGPDEVLRRIRALRAALVSGAGAHPVLAGRRVRLRPGRPEDAPRLRDILAEPSVSRWWGEPDPVSAIEEALRGESAARAVLTIEDGALTIAAPAVGQHADCYLSADPWAFLLVLYGRTGPLAPALAGRILAWGRRPWLAFTLPARFRRP